MQYKPTEYIVFLDNRVLSVPYSLAELQRRNENYEIRFNKHIAEIIDSINLNKTIETFKRSPRIAETFKKTDDKNSEKNEDLAADFYTLNNQPKAIIRAGVFEEFEKRAIRENFKRLNPRQKETFKRYAKPLKETYKSKNSIGTIYETGTGIANGEKLGQPYKWIDENNRNELNTFNYMHEIQTPPKHEEISEKTLLDIRQMLEEIQIHPIETIRFDGYDRVKGWKMHPEKNNDYGQYKPTTVRDIQVPIDIYISPGYEMDLYFVKDGFDFILRLVNGTNEQIDFHGINELLKYPITSVYVFPTTFRGTVVKDIIKMRPHTEKNDVKVVLIAVLIAVILFLIGFFYLYRRNIIKAIDGITVKDKISNATK